MSNINELYTKTFVQHFYKEITELSNGVKKRVVFVDYDDTLFVWNHSNMKYKRDILPSQVCGENPYPAVGYANEFLINALTVCKEDSVIILLSHVPTSIELESKKEMADTHCHGLFDMFIGTDGPDSKVRVMKTFADVYGLEYTSVMLIDDRYETLHNARELGFIGKTPMEVMMNGVW